MNSNNVIVSVVNFDKWTKNEFEVMFVIKGKRRLNPPLIYSITGLNPQTKYELYVCLQRSDAFKYKFTDGKWIPKAHSEAEAPNCISLGVQSGKEWMSRNVDLTETMVTSDSLKGEDCFVVQSHHRYTPCVGIVPVGDATAQELYVNMGQEIIFTSHALPKDKIKPAKKRKGAVASTEPSTKKTKVSRKKPAAVQEDDDLTVIDQFISKPNNRVQNFNRQQQPQVPAQQYQKSSNLNSAQHMYQQSQSHQIVYSNQMTEYHQSSAEKTGVTRQVPAAVPMQEDDDLIVIDQWISKPNNRVRNFNRQQQQQVPVQQYQNSPNQSNAQYMYQQSQTNHIAYSNQMTEHHQNASTQQNHVDAQYQYQYSQNQKLSSQQHHLPNGSSQNSVASNNYQKNAHMTQNATQQLSSFQEVRPYVYQQDPLPIHRQQNFSNQPNSMSDEDIMNEFFVDSGRLRVNSNNKSETRNNQFWTGVAEVPSAGEDASSSQNVSYIPL